MKRQKELPQREQFLTEEVLNAMSSNVFYGIGEPLIQREGDTHVPAEAYLDLVKALGCGAYRSWMHLTEVLKDPSTPDPEAVSAHTRLPGWAVIFRIICLLCTGLPGPWTRFIPGSNPESSGQITQTITLIWWHGIPIR